MNDTVVFEKMKKDFAKEWNYSISANTHLSVDSVVRVDGKPNIASACDRSESVM